MTEKAYQRAIIQQARNMGLYADNMEVSTCPGWPDIFIADGSAFILLEVKSGKYGPNRKIKTLLSKAQLPWRMNYLSTTDGKNLFLSIRMEHEIRTIYVTYDKCKQILAGATIGGMVGIDTKTPKETVELLAGMTGCV